MKDKNESLEEKFPRQEGDLSRGTSAPRTVDKSKTAKYVFIAILAIAVLTVLFLAIK